MRDVEEARWRELRARLHGFVGRRVGNPEDAEDVVQDVFVRMQRSIGGLSSAERLDAWAFRIARNAVADHYRLPKRRDVAGEAAAKVVDELAADGVGGEPSEDARAEMARCGAPMIRGLPDGYRRAIELTDLEGLTQAAAERLGLSVAGAKSRVQRGRARLKEMLLRCCEIETDRRGRVVAFEAREDGEGCSPCGDGRRGQVEVVLARGGPEPAPRKSSGIPRIVYRCPTLPPTLVRTDAENGSFCSYFTPSAVYYGDVVGHARGDVKAAEGEVFQEMSQNPQEVAERLEEVNEAVQELRGKRSQFYNPQTDKWVKRDKDSGQIMGSDEEPYKAVPRED